MQISIDDSDPVPVFTQLAEQIRAAVRAGVLRPGAPLPAIRQLAMDLQLNPNTVAKAYRLLERDGVIETRGRHGTCVHRDGAQRSGISLTERALPILSQAITALRETGLTDSEIRLAFGRLMRE